MVVPFKIGVSMCLPAFNEEDNIKKAIDDSIPVLNAISDDWEIVVVDDGSEDGTNKITKEIIELNKRVRLVQHDKNRGYGQALITSFAASRKEWIWLSASDSQFDPNEIFKMIPFIKDYDAIVGCRYNRADPPYRRLYAKLYNGLIKVVLGLSIKDINCGFKLIKRGIFDKISLESAGALIDAEFFYKCKKNNISLKEVAIEHKPREFGSQTGGNFMVVIRMFMELLRLRMGNKA